MIKKYFLKRLTNLTPRRQRSFFRIQKEIKYIRDSNIMDVDK